MVEDIASSISSGSSMCIKELWLQPTEVQEAHRQAMSLLGSWGRPAAMGSSSRWKDDQVGSSILWGVEGLRHTGERRVRPRAAGELRNASPLTAGEGGPDDVAAPHRRFRANGGGAEGDKREQRSCFKGTLDHHAPSS